MTHLKPTILTVFVLLALGLTVHAQSTALRPFEGATHTYSWNGLQSGNLYEFYLTADSKGSAVLDDMVTGEFDFIGSPAGTVETGQSSASVAIAWNHGAALHTYFVWFKVSTPGGCSNQRYVQVLPQANQFDLLSENVPVDNTVSCPAVAATDGFNAISGNYDAGATTLQFKVRRVNGTVNKRSEQPGAKYNWAFEPVLTVDPNWNLDMAIVSITGANSGTIVADASNLYTVNGLDNEVLVTVSVKNLPGTSQDVALKIQKQIELHTNLSDSNSGNDMVRHRIEVMPVIHGMGGV